MNIHDIEKNISQLERQLRDLLASVEPMKEAVEAIDKNIQETDKEYMDQLYKLQQERQATLEAMNKEKHGFQSKVWEVQADAGKIQTEMNKLKEEHAAALKDIAAQERLDALFQKVADFFSDSPWADSVKDFQKEDILAILQAYDEGKQGILNANVMGSGKTFESGAVLDIIRHLFYKDHGRQPLVLWLTRKSLMKSTAQELRQWNDERKFVVVEGNPEMRKNLLNIAVMGNFPVISNYELLNSTEEARQIEWDIVFFDECHKLKGGDKVKVFHHTKEVTSKASFFLGLSGSPIQNKPEDIWPIFNILDEQRFPSVRRFSREFTREAYDKKQGKFVTKVDEKRLLNVMKGQVIKQDPAIIQAAWPDKRRIFKVVEMNGEQREVYNQVKNGILSHFAKMAEDEPQKKISITAVIAQLTYLRQINVWPGGVRVQSPTGDEVWNVNCQESAKIDEAENLIEELTDEGEQVVVWSAQFNEPLFELERRIKDNFPHLNVELMYGGTKDPKRNEVAFQNGEIDVLLCNRSAVSEGFNFQKNPERWEGGASKAIFLDAWWNPKANEQAEDRIWRTGQSENVDIYYIYTDDSVDAFIAAKLDEKEAMIKGIMDSDALRPGDLVGILEELL